MLCRLISDKLCCARLSILKTTNRADDVQVTILRQLMLIMNLLSHFLSYALAKALLLLPGCAAPLCVSLRGLSLLVLTTKPGIPSQRFYNSCQKAWLDNIPMGRTGCERYLIYHVDNLLARALNALTHFQAPG